MYSEVYVFIFIKIKIVVIYCFTVFLNPDE